MPFIEALQANLLTPAVLFFVLGLIGAIARTDLRFPESLYEGLTLYLLIAIGFKGGVALAEAGFGAVWLPALGALLLGSLIPLWTYPVLRGVGRLSTADSAALAAHYGSVSAVTFIAATNYLKAVQLPYNNFATAFLALMESPAILIGLLIARMASRQGGPTRPLKAVLHEALLGRSIFLLVGALVVGALCGPVGLVKVEAFFVAPFQGILALFLLEMGLVAGRRLGDLKRIGPFLIAFGVLVPVVNSCLGVLVGWTTGLDLGTTTLLAVLSASASYIAAPAAIRVSLPEANPTLYLTAALAITFPFNITVGIPAYLAIARCFFPDVTP
jgi:hypothetical protein